MEVVSQINSVLQNHLPLYQGISKYAQDSYRCSLQSINKIYKTSETKVLKARKTTQGFKRQILALCSESADDLLDLVEDRLTMKQGQTSQKDKVKRVVRIMTHLKDEFILSPLQKAGEFNVAMVEKGKALNMQYIVPMFITLKATLLVSRQIMLEILAERLGQLKMTYKVSKDSVTMFFAGDFEEEKILARVGENINSFKQLTIQFVQKGMEIKISKRELFQNYNNVVEKLTRIVQGVSTKSIEQWNDTKTKTINLYQKVINRIKEKEVEIRTQYIKTTKQEVTQTKYEEAQERPVQSVSEQVRPEQRVGETTQVQVLGTKQ